MFGTQTMERTAADAASRHGEDAVLLAAVAAGDRGAFARIYEAHRKRVYRLAYGVLLDPNEARDAVQEAFLKLHQAAATWEPRAAIGTWLYRVVLNHCLGLKQRLLRFAKPMFMLAPSPPSPEMQVVLGQAVRVVERSLRELSAKQRAAATLFLEAEVQPAEIASLLDITPNDARVTLHRALARIRTDLTAAGLDALPTADETILAQEMTS